MQDEYHLKSRQTLSIVPIGDIHRGSPETNYQYLEYWKHTINHIKGPKRIYLMGDLIEAATKSLADSSYEQEMTLDDQINETIEFFEPYKEDIVFACNGNHELRLKKDYHLNITRLIARQLGCKSGNQHLDTFYINDKPFTVYVAHGKGSSMYHYTAESKIIRDTQTVDCDIVMHGHNHRCGHFSIPKTTSEGLKRKHYVFSGAFLSYGGYADTMQLPRLPEAFIYLGINKELRVYPNIFYIDERQPQMMKEV